MLQDTFLPVSSLQLAKSIFNFSQLTFHIVIHQLPIPFFLRLAILLEDPRQKVPILVCQDPIHDDTVRQWVLVGV